MFVCALFVLCLCFCLFVLVCLFASLSRSPPRTHGLVDGSAIPTVQYVNKPGSFTLYGKQTNKTNKQTLLFCFVCFVWQLHPLRRRPKRSETASPKKNIKLNGREQIGKYANKHNHKYIKLYKSGENIKQKSTTRINTKTQNIKKYNKQNRYTYNKTNKQ